MVVPISISSQPTSDVILSVSGTGLSCSPGTLTFTTSNYATPQDVTVTVTNDATDTSGIEVRPMLVRCSSTSDNDYIMDSVIVGIKTFDNFYSVNAVLAQDTAINSLKKINGKGLDSLRIQLTKTLWGRYSLPTQSATVS